MENRTFEGKWPSTAPFRRFKRFEASGAICSFVEVRAGGSFGLVTSQMRISSRSEDIKRRKVNANARFVGRLRFVRNVGEVWNGWFDC
ncbi:MAG: hypothetical protein ACTS6G_04415 [Candidatus Hodgkinia cicadicola]